MYRYYIIRNKVNYVVICYSCMNYCFTVFGTRYKMVKSWKIKINNNNERKKPKDNYFNPSSGSPKSRNGSLILSAAENESVFPPLAVKKRIEVDWFETSIFVCFAFMFLCSKDQLQQRRNYRYIFIKKA